MPAKKKHTTPDKSLPASAPAPALPNPKEFRQYLRRQACAGIRQFLEEVMLAELDTLLGVGWAERAPARSGYRNGYRTRSLLTTEGQIEELQVPRDREGRYQTQVFERYSRYEPAVREALVEMYVAGAGVEKVGEVAETLTGHKVSPQAVSRLTGDLAEQFAWWQSQPLAEHWAILYPDAIHYQVRHNEATDPLTVLAVLGVDDNGVKHLLALRTVAEEDYAGWHALFNDLRQRGLSRAEVIVTDGHSGLIRAVSEVYSASRRQRCTLHKTRNVINAFPTRLRRQVSGELTSVWEQPDLSSAQAVLAAFKARYGQQYPQAISNLAEEEEKTLSFYELPQSWWRYTRTTNAIESMFSQVRDRTDRVDVFTTEESCLLLVWARATAIKFQCVKLE